MPLPLTPGTTVPPGQMLHADSNVFNDRPGAPGARQILDTYLADPTKTIFLTAAAISEVGSSPSEQARLWYFLEGKNRANS